MLAMFGCGVEKNLQILNPLEGPEVESCYGYDYAQMVK